jgi:fluoride exporter
VEFPAVRRRPTGTGAGEPEPGPEATPRRAPPRPALEVLAVVAVGGALGTLGRYELALTVPTRAGAVPWSVLLVNVVGAFALGVFATLALERWRPTRLLRPFLGVGLCGGLTTFSTWMVDVARLADTGRVATAGVDVALTLGAGFIALLAGVRAVRSLRTGRRPR